ncbi:MAG: tryptophan synthase subunit alpha [Acidimicrobiales bacterium]
MVGDSAASVPAGPFLASVFPASLAHGPGTIEARLRSIRDEGRKSLCCYLMGGMSPDWVSILQAISHGGADVIEVGIPFSDPMIDGPVIQAASRTALDSGATPARVLDEISRVEAGVPLVVMTYYNLLLKGGLSRMARSMSRAGISGSIVADLPPEESEPWIREADESGIENIMLVAPTTPLERARHICESTRGFVYCVGAMGVTGERDSLARTAKEVAAKVMSVTDKPALVGIGVSTPTQAASVCTVADGVIVGSAIVRRVMEGAGAEGVEEFVRSLRDAVDS